MLTLYRSVQMKSVHKTAQKNNERMWERERDQKSIRERECFNVIFIFLKVYLGDSNRQLQSSRENLE